MNCKRCGHDDYTHLMDGYGRCQAYIIKWESTFHEYEMAPGIKGWNQDIEYSGQCECEGMYSARSNKEPVIKDMDLSQFLEREKPF